MTTLYFSDYVDGGGWAVQLALSNVDPTAAAAVVVTAYDQEGQPGPELFDSETTFEIPSRGSRVLRSAGAGSIRRGWIQVQNQAASVRGLLTYRHGKTGIEVGVEPVPLRDHFALFVEESTGIGTGLAIFKPDAAPEIEFQIRNQAGLDPIGEVLSWGNFQQRAQTIPEWFERVNPEILKDFQGLLYLRAADGSSFAPLGRRFGKRRGSLSAVPAIPILDARPPTVSLSASPASIEWGRSATLRWSSTGAVSATLTPDIGAVPTSGSHSVSPTRTTTYRVTVRGGGGQTQTAMASAKVTVVISELAALMALYDSTGGSSWTSSESWLTGRPLGEWRGVEVDDHGRVTSLNLSDNDLTGAIPEELGSLANLTWLWLGYNALTGPIPVELGGLANLTKLWLSGNDLTGPIPAQLGSLANLTWLKLDGNDGLCVPGSANFVRWSKGIENFWAEFCNDSDRAILEVLYEVAGGSGWTNSAGWRGDGALGEWYGVSVDSLGRVTGLDLSHNGLEGRLPIHLGRLSQMTELRIGNNALSGRLPLSLSSLPALREFHYADTELCAPVEAGFQAWLNGIASHAGAGMKCAPLSDRDILVALYEATGGPNWTSSENWLTGRPLGEWHGVEVDDHGRVISLRRFNNDLAGLIPGGTRLAGQPDGAKSQRQ